MKFFQHPGNEIMQGVQLNTEPTGFWKNGNNTVDLHHGLLLPDLNC